MITFPSYSSHFGTFVIDGPSWYSFLDFRKKSDDRQDRSVVYNIQVLVSKTKSAQDRCCQVKGSN